MSLDRLTWLYNSVEPFVWYGVAIVGWFALRRYAGPWRRGLLVLLLAAFGTSDFFETQAWWTPWWLLAWKASTLIGLVGLVLVLARDYRRSTTSKAS